MLNNWQYEETTKKKNETKRKCMGVYIHYARLFIESQSKDMCRISNKVQSMQKRKKKKKKKKKEMNETFSSFYHPLLLYM